MPVDRHCSAQTRPHWSPPTTYVPTDHLLLARPRHSRESGGRSSNTRSIEAYAIEGESGGRSRPWGPAGVFEERRESARSEEEGPIVEGTPNCRYNTRSEEEHTIGHDRVCSGASGGGKGRGKEGESVQGADIRRQPRVGIWRSRPNRYTSPRHVRPTAGRERHSHRPKNLTQARAADRPNRTARFESPPPPGTCGRPAAGPATPMR